VTTFLSTRIVCYTVSVLQRQIFFLYHCWLHRDNISETTTLSSPTVFYTVSEFQRQYFYLNPFRQTLSVIRNSSVFLYHPWLKFISISQKVFYPHPLSVTLCQDVTDNISILTHYWWLCVNMSEITVLFSPTVVYNVPVCQKQQFYLTHYLLQFVSLSETKDSSSRTFGYILSVYQRQQFFPHTLLAALWQYTRYNKCILIDCCLHCYNIPEPTFILKHLFLHSVSFSDTNDISSHTVCCNGSVYKKQQLYSHTLFFKMYQYIRDNSFILNHCWLHCVSIRDTTNLSLNLCWLHCIIISETNFIFTHSWLHCVSLSETAVISSNTFVCTVSVYQRQISITSRYWLK